MKVADAFIRTLSEMSHHSVRNYITPGLTSSLLGGDGHGMVRLFTADRDTREWITPHSHRFNFSCIVIRGQVENLMFTPGAGNKYCPATLRRKGGIGDGYEVVRNPENAASYTETSRTYVAGDTYSLTYTDIHSIRFSKDAVVLFLEGPFVAEETTILEPFSNGSIVETFEMKPWMFQKDAK